MTNVAAWLTVSVLASEIPEKQSNSLLFFVLAALVPGDDCRLILFLQVELFFVKYGD